MDSVVSWVKRVGSWLGGRGLLEGAWQREWDRPRVRRRGPLAAAQATLKRLGWSARGLLDWTDEAGVAVRLGDQVALKAAVRRSFRAREWESVAGRRADFRGAAGGVDEELTGGLCRKLAKRGNERKAGALRCILAGGTRLAAAGLV